ncbi:MAG TPA: phytoene/squalene synthase family protein [Blastocatellia bacterium]|nr:phytoene/squalene synthase family protein [Blastocatellia bacterium]
MLEAIKKSGLTAPWSEDHWRALERETRREALTAPTEEASWGIIIRRARVVMRAYTTSFFIVTRFLPAMKRDRVEAIYAAVRYPDEIVDTFPLSEEERLCMLAEWEAGYELGLDSCSIREALEAGVTCYLASFTRVVRDSGIPHEHYRAFIDAMRCDVRPRLFATLDDLIESYIYGSAIVVGYFLTYVYGAAAGEDFERALTSARNLGIALQLTNFLRDIGEDQRRGRIYLPLDMLAEEGVTRADVSDARQHESLSRVLRRLAAVTECYYRSAEADLDAFAPDCRVAIRACIDVYRQLNDRIGRSPQGILHRESVPISEKFRVLPASKYWRLPLAYLGR